MLRRNKGHEDDKGKKPLGKKAKRQVFYEDHNPLTPLEYFIYLCSFLFVAVFSVMQGVFLYKLHVYEAALADATMQLRRSDSRSLVATGGLAGGGNNQIAAISNDNRQRIQLMANATRRPFKPWPPLEAIVDKHGNITGDPQFLLDFAIIGFEKCGTNTLKLMFHGHTDIDCAMEENYKLFVNKPHKFIANQYNLHPNRDFKRCYSNNIDIFQPCSLKLIDQYFPETKLVIALRHPVRHFESVYNAKIQNLNDANKAIPSPNDRIGLCHTHDEGVCTDHAHFALWLYKLGKTFGMPTTEVETTIRKTHEYAAEHESILSRNKIFLVEMSQLTDQDWFRQEALLEDLAAFLDLKHPFQNGIPQAHPAPGMDNQDIRNKRKIDICQDQYTTLREELMQAARESSLWIREQFLKSPDVFVSSPDYFEKAILSWMDDPCDVKTKKEFDTKTIENEIPFTAEEQPISPVEPGTLRVYNTSVTWPPLEAIVQNDKLVGDPQFLLDFAIIGIEKCGTSTLMKWLGAHPEIQCLQHEDTSLYMNQPGVLAKKMYRQRPGENYKRGYKNPIDLFQPCVLRNFKEVFPQTKLLLTIRHPVRYFESLHNFRIQNLPTPNDEFTPPLERIGICKEHSQGLCTDHANFALWMYRLGKTIDMPQTDVQKSIITTHPYEAKHYTYPSSNKIFLTEMNQFMDKNAERSATLRQDLAKFLELQHTFDQEAPHAKPGMKWSAESQAIRDSRKIDICEEQYRSLREELMRGARETSLWIRTSFLASKDVTVSSPEFFNELMQAWMEDPCDTLSDQRSLSKLPPLSSLVDDDDKIIGDVQFLLDFAIIGVEKCGTSTLMSWLGSHPEIQCPQKENYNMMREEPGQLVRDLYAMRPDEDFKRGYKNPVDIFYPGTSLSYLHRYFPKTKLLITLRHPVRYFESLHNFRIQNHNEGNWKTSHIATAFDRIGPCIGYAGDGCTEHAHFGLWLYRLGKTLSLPTTETEKALFEAHPVGAPRNKPLPMENEIFLTEMTQFSDKDPGRQQTLKDDLKNFLGVKTEFNSTAPHYKPGKAWKPDIQAVRDSFKINICDEQFRPVRDVLMKGARESSIWIRESFIKSPDVHISSPEFFEQAMLAWMDDPCAKETPSPRGEERIRKNLMRGDRGAGVREEVNSE